MGIYLMSGLCGEALGFTLLSRMGSLDLPFTAAESGGNRNGGRAGSRRARAGV
jgi:hypothetical protein